MGTSRGIASSLFMVTTVLMGTLSTTALAAHQVAIQCAAFTFIVPLGIGMAGSVRVGQAAGAGDASGARRAGGVAMGVAGTFMGFTALCFLLFPRPIVGLYLDLSAPENAAVVRLAVELLGIAAVFQGGDGLQVVAHGALQGLLIREWISTDLAGCCRLKLECSPGQFIGDKHSLSAKIYPHTKC